MPDQPPAEERRGPLYSMGGHHWKRPEVLREWTVPEKHLRQALWNLLDALDFLEHYGSAEDTEMVGYRGNEEARVRAEGYSEEFPDLSEFLHKAADYHDKRLWDMFESNPEAKVVQLHSNLIDKLHELYSLLEEARDCLDEARYCLKSFDRELEHEYNNIHYSLIEFEHAGRAMGSVNAILEGERICRMASTIGLDPTGKIISVFSEWIDGLELDDPRSINGEQFRQISDVISIMNKHGYSSMDGSDWSNYVRRDFVFIGSTRHNMESDPEDSH